jgi:hypothetical protein
MSRVSAPLKRRTRRRARGICEYCQSSSELTGHEFTVDHVVPESQGGKTIFQNLCWCCFWCNSYKQSRTQAVDTRTGRTVTLFNPRTDKWEEHFRWSRDGSRILGRTARWRATIETLRLNRSVLVRARRVWVRHELHPPR